MRLNLVCFIFVVFRDLKLSVKLYTGKIKIGLLCNGKIWPSTNMNMQRLLESTVHETHEYYIKHILHSITKAH